MAANAVYVYGIEINVPLANPTEYVNKIDLNTFRTPFIKTYPNNQTASGGTVTFKCEAEGKPTPTITWEKIGSSQSFTQGSTLTIPNFDASKVGVYRCTAKSFGITENATATGFVQFSTCGSGCSKEELGIEMTDLTFTTEYENSSTNTYRKLKNEIETECLSLYARGGKSIYKCEVLRFRRGSVISVVELAWPTSLVGPKDPLLSAINNGNFAGHTVTRHFISPTNPPTNYPTTATPTNYPTTATPTNYPTTATPTNYPTTATPTNYPTTATPTNYPTTATFTGSPKPTNIRDRIPDEQCSCSAIIAVTVTMIVLLLLSNIVTGFFLWKKLLKIKGIKNTQQVVCESALSRIPSLNTPIATFTAPLYQDISDVNNTIPATGIPNTSLTPQCSGSDNYQSLQGAGLPSNYEKLSFPPK